MDHIFGDSDDIDFGSTPIASRSSVSPSLSQPDRQVVSLRAPVPRLSPRPDTLPRVSRAPAPRIAPSLEPAFIDKTPALSRLIAGMKPSFLPRDEDTSSMRIIALSAPTSTDPLFMIRCDDTTILIGSGFGSISRAGREYPTFPDMRLIFSEKDRIRAWILTDATIDVNRFEFILSTLGFPAIYATRDVITSFRNNIKNIEFLESCRFFELFADGTSARRIGDIECIIADIDMTTHLGLRAGGSTIAFSDILLESADLGSSASLIVTHSNIGFSIADGPFAMGEVLSLRTNTIGRNAMKFTFDTFFVDGLSLGVVAGYALGDRDQLAESGVLIFTLEEDSRARTIAGHIFIDSRGFVHAYEMMYIHKEILKGIRSTYEKLLTENPKIERGELVQWLRREITKYCYLLTGRTPVVMPIVIER